MPCCILCCLLTSRAVLKRFRRVTKALFWCSIAKRKSRQNSDFLSVRRLRRIIPLENYPRPQFLQNFKAEKLQFHVHSLDSQFLNGSLEESIARNAEADRARDKSIASKRSVWGIANRVNGRHGTATSLLWISGGIEAGGNFPAELFALRDGQSGNHCSASSFS